MEYWRREVLEKGIDEGRKKGNFGKGSLGKGQFCTFEKSWSL